MTRRVTTRTFSHATYAAAQNIRADAKRQGRAMGLGEALRLAEGDTANAQTVRLETEQPRGNA